jgi:chromosome segregation ATPase
MLQVRLSLSLITVAAFSSGVSRLAAQQPAVPPPATTPRPVFDPGAALVPPRGIDRIEADLELVKNDARFRDADKAAATDHRARAEAETEVKKHEISTIEARMKLADKEKNQAEKSSLAAQKKVAEQERQLLERRAELAKTEIDVADKRAEFARASRTALESELELARQRDARSRLAAADSQAAHLDAVILELSRKVLEAQRDRADVEANVAGKEKQLSERRLAVLQAQTRNLQK